MGEVQGQSVLQPRLPRPPMVVVMQPLPPATPGAIGKPLRLHLARDGLGARPGPPWRQRLCGLSAAEVWCSRVRRRRRPKRPPRKCEPGRSSPSQFWMVGWVPSPALVTANVLSSGGVLESALNSRALPQRALAPAGEGISLLGCEAVREGARFFVGLGTSPRAGGASAGLRVPRRGLRSPSVSERPPQSFRWRMPAGLLLASIDGSVDSSSSIEVRRAASVGGVRRCCSTDTGWGPVAEVWGPLLLRVPHAVIPAARPIDPRRTRTIQGFIVLPFHQIGWIRVIHSEFPLHCSANPHLPRHGSGEVVTCARVDCQRMLMPVLRFGISGYRSIFLSPLKPVFYLRLKTNILEDTGRSDGRGERRLYYRSARTRTLDVSVVANARGPFRPRRPRAPDRKHRPCHHKQINSSFSLSMLCNLGILFPLCCNVLQ